MKKLAWLVVLIASVCWGQDRVQLQINASEAELALAIVEKHAKGMAISDAEWQKLLESEPYVRLKKRETAMRRPFTDDEFKAFLLSADVAAKAPSLRKTLDAWEKADLDRTGERILPYLPATAKVRAKVYPMIKPKHNSFVFETETDPAIFLYIDPKVSQAQFENTVAHECHHIGFSDAGKQYDKAIEALPANARKAAEWMGGFGEGLAVLAAAGSSDVPPMRDFPEEDRVRWDLAMKMVDGDLEDVNQFFEDVIHGGYAKPEVADHVGFLFMGYRGPWYTVGYDMGRRIEKRYGRQVLIECMADPRKLLATYNKLAKEENATGKGEKLPLWSEAVLKAVGAPE